MAGSVGNITTDIIKNGLVFNMDAANRASYLKTGTTATNTINNTAGTLSSSPTFNPNTGSGVFDMDGTDYIYFSSFTGLPTGNSTYTLSAWINPDSGYGHAGIIGYGNYGSTSETNAFRLRGSDQQLRNYWWGNDIGIVIGDISNTWNYAVATYDGTNRRLYLNGVDIGGDTPSTPNFGNTTVTFGKTYTSEYFPGSIGPTHIYNRALSSTEVLHNYNALKGRFGL